MRRYGFGEQTGVSSEGELPQFENGHVEFSENAAKHATQQHPKESPAGAVALELAKVGGVDLEDYAEPNVDAEAVQEAVESVDGVGEETADEVLSAIQEAI